MPPTFFPGGGQTRRDGRESREWTLRPHFPFFISSVIIARRDRGPPALEARLRSDKESLLTQLSFMLARDSCGGLRMTFRSVISKVPYFILMRALTGTRLLSLVIQIVNPPSPEIIRSGPKTSGSTRNVSTRPSTVFFRFFSITCTGT